MSRPVELFRFWVGGLPVQQGSKTVFNGRPVDANQSKLKPWRGRIRDAAAMAYDGERIDQAAIVNIEFRFERPKSVKREFPSVAPDLDKLVRAVFDGLTDSKIWRDDCLAVDLHTTKRYADQAGALVRVGTYPTREK
ncbi:RusA family crossover junction endodeoxyribonuclease [Subtercola sp. YIM 133946]|uniref:RusA family crossover junction endodeoxyribonuclease n=1 Tax=Subtercola sp. YIM 133946 TaxID=3118909 RepID=UPI002F9224D0